MNNMKKTSAKNKRFLCCDSFRGIHEEFLESDLSLEGPHDPSEYDLSCHVASTALRLGLVYEVCSKYTSADKFQKIFH